MGQRTLEMVALNKLETQVGNLVKVDVIMWLMAVVSWKGRAYIKKGGWQRTSRWQQTGEKWGGVFRWSAHAGRRTCALCSPPPLPLTRWEWNSLFNSYNGLQGSARSGLLIDLSYLFSYISEYYPHSSRNGLLSYFERPNSSISGPLYVLLPVL